MPTLPSLNRIERLVAVSLGWDMAPAQAALLVRDDERPFALIGRWAGGGALIGSEPVTVGAEGDDPFALLDCHPRVPSGDGLGAGAAAGGRVGGGWFGWLGYGLGRRLEPVGSDPPAPEPAQPPFSLAFYDHVVRLDADGRWWFEALWSPGRASALRARLARLKARAADAPEPHPFSTKPWTSTPGAAGHALAVDACRRRIAHGDLFQANLCLRLQSRLRGAPIDLFVAATEALHPDRAAFVAEPERAIASLSPELFLERHGRRVRSAPIKGTRRRPADPGLADVECAALRHSTKDRAENVMIVDLVRNDLGRVCEFGSVRVPSLCQVRPHAGVFHLVSEVEGELRDGVGDADLVRAAFPPGSVSGAPKVASMNVIAELESTPRHAYTGAVGFSSPLAGLELSVAIRTFEFQGDRAWLGVGGGIVSDSDPAGEAAECATKAEPLLSAIGARRRSGRGRSPAPVPWRAGPSPIPRPDPAAGVFETLLIVDGRAVALERHLRRLARSVAALYGHRLPTTLLRQVREAAASAERARMRVDFRAGAIAITVRPIGERVTPIRLVPRTLPGGLGEHKWSDRRLLDACGGEGEPLLCDLDGEVLETARGSLFAVDADGRLLTAPADGRILPGVTRARVIELAERLDLEVHVKPISLTMAADAAELFVTGAVGGVEPAFLTDQPLHPGETTQRLAEALRLPRRAETHPLTSVAWF
jgi:para-aminobenzoate synthetase / 4-amino-4-deoxychorismate lyase